MDDLFVMSENQISENWYSAKELAEMCGVEIMTFSRFINDDIYYNTDVIIKNTKKRARKLGGDLYNDILLKEFQSWLMRNQANQGRSSEVVKTETENAVVQDLAIQTIIQTGNVKAMQCLMNHYISETQAVAQAKEQAKLIEEMKPKVEIFEKISDSSGLLTVEMVAQKLGYGKNNFFKKLRELKIFKYVSNEYGKLVNLPIQEYVNRGYFEVKEKPYKSGNEDRVYSQIFVTAKGELWLSQKVA